MDESVLWAIAIGTGVLGLLLLAVAGAVAVYWNTVSRRPQRAPYADKPQSYAGDLTAARKEQSPANSFRAQPTTVNSPWLWIKAWLFALLHAGTVSVVMGGVTFFQDLAKSSEEIQTTGAVTFPKQLLPGTLSGSTTQKQLSRSTENPSKVTRAGEAGKPSQSKTASGNTSDWEVVDLVNEVVSDNR
jgi:hypothetical protein